MKVRAGRRWLVIGGLVVALAIWFGAPTVARRLDFFRVRRIEFVGMRYVAPKAALAALALPQRASIFDDLDSIAVRAAATPGVQRAEVGRRLPGTLIVRVVEVPAVALVPGPSGAGGRLALMDSAGQLLPYDPLLSTPDLPVAAGSDARIGRLLREVQRLDPGLFDRIASASRAGDDVALVVDGRRLLFRPDASLKEMRAVMAVAQDLARKGRRYAELDGRYAGYVVVRGLGA